jgi:hypothetical protein
MRGALAARESTARRPRATTARARGRRARARAGRPTRANLVDDFLATFLPREVNEARREMEYFDGPGGMLARIVPGREKPTVRAPEVRGDVVFDFGEMSAEAFAATFNALNDVVMGGASDAAATLTKDGFARLAGETEDVRGGFASVKSRDFDRALDLSAYEGLKLMVRGDGKTYKCILYDTNDSFNVAFHQTFVAPRDVTEVKLKFSDFVPVKRGRGVATNDAEYRKTNGGKIVAMQFMLSKFAYGMEEKNAGYAPGPFEFELKRVEAYR